MRNSQSSGNKDLKNLLFDNTLGVKDGRDFVRRFSYFAPIVRPFIHHHQLAFTFHKHHHAAPTIYHPPSPLKPITTANNTRTQLPPNVESKPWMKTEIG